MYNYSKISWKSFSRSWHIRRKSQTVACIKSLANKAGKLYNEREVVCLEQLQKQYKELTFTDDFMFGKVLVNNPEICRRLLEVLLDIKIKEISFPERQKNIEIISDGKGIRLDVYVDDENGTIYNIEMQTKVKKEYYFFI